MIESRAEAALLAELRIIGMNALLLSPDGRELRTSEAPPRVKVEFATERAAHALLERSQLDLAEAFLAGDIRIEGRWLEALKIVEVIDMDPSLLSRAKLATQLLIRRRRLRQKSVEFHYDRPAEFFLPWFERWRSYTHGFYSAPDDEPAVAQARKLQFAIDALELKPGMRVLDVGAGWGSFLEFAGLQGIEVHGVTLSAQQHRFVCELIERERLPRRSQLLDYFDLESADSFDAAVFMGSLEHLVHYDRVFAKLGSLLSPGAGVYADFCAQMDAGSTQVGAFLAKYIWPGTATYVHPPTLIEEMSKNGFDLLKLEDDTASYCYTVRDWANAIEEAFPSLATDFGEVSVRAFLLFLRGSEYFLANGKSRAFHLVAKKSA